MTSVSQKLSITTYKSSNASVINKLAKQLEEEKKEREKMQREIDALKKINSDLCSAVLSATKSEKTKK